MMRLPQRFLEHVFEDVHQPLTDFEGDIADEAITYNHVSLAV